MKKNLREKIKKIELLVMDVDGVLTDGKLTFTEDGKEIKSFFVQDGMAINLWLKANLKLVIISGRDSKIMEMRGKELGIKEIYQKVDDKLKILKLILKKHKLKLENIAYIADDLNDFPAFKFAGFKISPSNACPEIKKISDYITKRKGGEGAVREAIELMLKEKNKWNYE
jgi:3-deoxy-D-manno-octulosonate 8-phosphate phosphatase (KDO 8-P phosphatase)